jgi:hypothetical protein
MALYLDPLTKDTGCVRFIPGSHRVADGFGHILQNRPASDAGLRIGLAPSQLHGAGQCLLISVFSVVYYNYSVLILNAILWLDFLGLALSLMQVARRDLGGGGNRDAERVHRVGAG